MAYSDLDIRTQQAVGVAIAVLKWWTTLNQIIRKKWWIPRIKNALCYTRYMNISANTLLISSLSSSLVIIIASESPVIKIFLTTMTQ